MASHERELRPASPKVKRTASRSFWEYVFGPKVAPYLFILPFFLVFGFFFVYPFLWSLVLSFQEWSRQETVWVGLKNFEFVLKLPDTGIAFSNLVWYVIVNNVLQLTIALAVVYVMDSTFLRRFAGVLRIGYFAPNITPAVVTALLFAIILGSGGLSDKVLGIIGLKIPWMQSTQWSKPAVLIAGGWQWIGYWVVVLHAGVQSIPDEYYEVAALDGATLWQRFRLITFPLLRPVFLFVVIMNTIGTMQMFEYPLLLFGGTGGGPLNSATTPVLELYNLGFLSFDLGSASALGWMLAVLIILVSVLQFAVARWWGWTE